MTRPSKLYVGETGTKHAAFGPGPRAMELLRMLSPPEARLTWWWGAWRVHHETGVWRLLNPGEQISATDFHLLDRHGYIEDMTPTAPHPTYRISDEGLLAYMRGLRDRVHQRNW